jgi:immune inhibitor A
MLKNTTKVICVMVTMALLASGLLMAVPALTATSSGNVASTQKAPAYDVIDVDQKMAKQTGDLSDVYYADTAVNLNAYAPGNFYNISDQARFYVGSNGKWYYNGSVFSPLTSAPSNYMVFTKRGEGNMCEVWVANDLEFFPGDPRNTEQPWNLTVSNAKVNYIIDQFDNVIYPNMTEFFGPAPPRDGENSLFKDLGRPYFGTNVTGRLMLMVFNIVDTNLFADENNCNFINASYPSYVAGYSWGYTDYIYDRNIIQLDNWQWDNRTLGPDVNHFRPFVIESVVAHEYQHELNAWLNGAQDTFLNEGASIFAEFLCGYGVAATAHIQWFLATPDNGLTVWGDQGDINILADYGAAGLFVMYLADHFGPDMVKNIVNTTNVGIDAVNQAFVAIGMPDWNFNKVFNYWRLANLIHSDTPGRGWYDYTSIDIGDLGGASTVQWSTFDNPMTSAADYFGPTYTLIGDNTGNSLLNAYGTDYIQVVNGGENWANYLNAFDLKLQFSGDTNVVRGWQPVLIDVDGTPTWFWYSGTGDMVDTSMVTTLDLTGMETADLSFLTWWAFEEQYDFGFTQISTDGGATWTSLSNDYTTSDYAIDALPQIVANMPGLNGVAPFDGFQTIHFDLSEYVGSVVMLKFRMMTDPYTHDEGWYVTDLSLNGALLDNANDVRTLEPIYPSVSWMVTAYFPGGTGTDGIWYLPLVMNLNLAQMDASFLHEIGGLVNYQEMIIIVSPTDGPADYGFAMVNGVSPFA